MKATYSEVKQKMLEWVEYAREVGFVDVDEENNTVHMTEFLWSHATKHRFYSYDEFVKATANKRLMRMLIPTWFRVIDGFFDEGMKEENKKGIAITLAIIDLEHSIRLLGEGTEGYTNEVKP